MTAFALTPDISWGAVRVWQRNRDATLRNWKTEFLGIAVEPFAIILALGLALGQFVELDSGEKYVEFLTPGLLALFPMFAATFECAWGSYMRLEVQGTYESIIATPISVDDVITGEILWGTTRALVNGTYILIVASILNPWLHMVDSPWAILAVPVGVLPGLLFSSISICFASIARAMSHFAYFFNLVINPLFWFGGAFFPVRRDAAVGADPGLVHAPQARGRHLPGACQREPGVVDAGQPRLAGGGDGGVLRAGGEADAPAPH